MATLIDALQNGNPLSALASIYSTVEVRSNLTPPVVVDLNDALSNGQTGPNWFLKLTQPTVVFTGNAGQTVIAPAGAAGDGTLALVGIVAGLVGIGFFLGRMTKR